VDAVSSIFFCYLIFPWLLPFLQSCSRPVLQHWIWGAIMLQLALVALGYVWFNDVLGFDSVAWHCGNGWDAWVLAYKHPLYNLPHFVLGILGGLLRKAGPSLLGTSSEAPQSSACDASCVSPPLLPERLPALTQAASGAVRAKRARTPTVAGRVHTAAHGEVVLWGLFQLGQYGVLLDDGDSDGRGRVYVVHVLV
jgi:hypothetical protein